MVPPTGAGGFRPIAPRTTAADEGSSGADGADDDDAFGAFGDHGGKDEDGEDSFEDFQHVAAPDAHSTAVVPGREKQRDSASLRRAYAALPDMPPTLAPAGGTAALAHNFDRTLASIPDAAAHRQLFWCLQLRALVADADADVGRRWAAVAAAAARELGGGAAFLGALVRGGGGAAGVGPGSGVGTTSFCPGPPMGLARNGYGTSVLGDSRVVAVGGTTGPSCPRQRCWIPPTAASALPGPKAPTCLGTLRVRRPPAR